MEKTLEEKIEERKQQAVERNIIEKTRVVAEGYGIPVKLKDDDDAVVEGCRYESGLLRIDRLNITAFPTHGFPGKQFAYTSVQYNNKSRFQAEGGEVTGYNPGNWEQDLDKLYDQCMPSKQQTEDRSKIERRELAEKWGLD